MRIPRAVLPLAPFLLVVLTSCGQVLSPDPPQLDALGLGPAPSATGDVEIVWMGGRGMEVSPGEEKLAYADLVWFDAFKSRGDRGQFHYLVVGADGSLHREIVAEVAPDVLDTGVVIDGTTAYFVGLVTYDSKAAAAGHDEGGPGGGPEIGGETGCDDTTEEGGCSGEDGTTAGGGHEEEDGCSGGHEDEGSGGPKHPPGSGSRVGQIVAAVVTDGGSPGAGHDSVAWSWFAEPTAEHPTYLQPPTISALGEWPELCDKPILGGNLVVHERH
jgi:hypothetical protein